MVKMRSLLWIAVLLLISCAAVHAQQSSSTEWWQHAVIYQVYPRTFKDSGEDGVGDLQGIISKLDHLKEINVDAIWISPIYPSSNVDGGYDITNYVGIDDIFGTMEDFEELVAKAGEMGIKIIMDLVPNHSSIDHPWFTQSAEGNEKYADYYVWRDGESKDKPPYNWNSVFGGKAWTYHEGRGQFYLHQFTDKQPDLNFENPAVKEAMKDVITFWLDKGVAGFRVDAIRHLFEEYQDEPETNSGADPDSYDYYQHIYSADHDKTYEIIYEWREYLEEYTKANGGEPRILMTEAYADVKEVMRYYGDGDNVGAQFPFNFDLIDGLNKNSDARDIVVLIHRWFAYMPNGFTPNWVLGNHDKHRIATRLESTDLANMMNMLSSVLPGVMVTYNGEEIGMENGEVTFTEGQDPSGCAAGQDGFDEVSRDFERTPFHWDDTDNAGFTVKDATPWLPVSEKYKTNNLAKQKDERASVYQNYKALTALRKNSKTLAEGTWEIYSINQDGILAIRKHPEDNTILFVAHIGRTDTDFEVDLTRYGYEPSSQKFDVIASNVEEKFGSTLELSNSIIPVKAKQAYVLRSSAVSWTISILLLLASVFVSTL